MNLLPRGDSSRRARRLDFALGVALGLVLGIAIVAAFVFLGSEETIDAPRVSGADAGRVQQVREGAADLPSLDSPFR